jgi:dihydroorotase
VKYDAVIKGGRIIDPASGIDRLGELAVREGRIAAVEESIEPGEAETYDARGCIVCPGLIDLHTHVCWGNTWGINADLIGPKTGVVTFADFGTTGAGNFEGFYEHIIKSSGVRIFAFLHIAYTGLLGAVYRPESLRIIGELEDIRLAMVGEAVETARKYPDTIRGIKVRASVEAAGSHTLEALRLARKAARILNLPLVAHIGQPPAVIEDVLDSLESGDILTHSFRGPLNSLLDSRGEIIPQGLAARERGVIFDIGHGMGSFSFDSARKLLQLGFPPDTISSDLHAYSIKGPAYDLPTTMSKFLALGVNPVEILKAVTVTPATILGQEDELGDLKEGSLADITVLELQKGRVSFEDVNQDTLEGNQRFVPRMTFKDGRLLWAAS